MRLHLEAAPLRRITAVNITNEFKIVFIVDYLTESIADNRCLIGYEYLEHKHSGGEEFSAIVLGARAQRGAEGKRH